MADGQGRTQLITDFAGENYRLRDTSLPPNVSPDALNCDYFHGTIRKRPGWYTEWDCFSTPPGNLKTGQTVLGVYVQNDTTYYVIYGDPILGLETYHVRAFKCEVGNVPVAVGVDSYGLKSLTPFRVQRIGNMALWWQRKLPSWYSLIIEPLNVSSTFATPSGSGTLNGVRKYYIVARNSSDGHESDLDYSNAPASAIVTSASATNAAQYDLTYIPTSSDPQVDKVRIYATKTGGSVFYYLADIDNGTTTYADSAADSTLTVPYNQYRGAMPEAPGLPLVHDMPTPFLWQDRLWALGYENDRWVYKWSERDFGDGLPLYCLFYPYNYINIAGGSEPPWDAYPVDDRYILLALHDGLYAIVGESPSNYRCLPVVTGTPYYRICVTDNYVYAFGPFNVVRIPRGSLGPVEDISSGISSELNKVGYLHRNQRRVVAFPVPARKEVWFSYNLCNADGTPSEPVTDGFKYHRRWTLVWSEERQTWAKWDLPLEQFDVPLSLERNKHIVGIQGHLCSMSVNPDSVVYVNDGATTSGTVVSSGDDYVITDTWGAYLFRGMTVTVKGANGLIQRRCIHHEDPVVDNKIYVDEDWDTNPSPGDLWTYGEMPWYWTSPGLALTDDRFASKRTHRIKTIFHPVGEISTDNVTLTYRFDENAEQDKTLDATERVHEVITDDVGKELRLKYAHSGYGESVEIEGIQIELEMQE